MPTITTKDGKEVSASLDKSGEIIISVETRSKKLPAVVRIARYGTGVFNQNAEIQRRLLKKFVSQMEVSNEAAAD